MQLKHWGWILAGGRGGRGGGFETKEWDLNT